jgi:hypothetical protein
MSNKEKRKEKCSTALQEKYKENLNNKRKCKERPKL